MAIRNGFTVLLLSVAVAWAANGDDGEWATLAAFEEGTPAAEWEVTGGHARVPRDAAFLAVRCQEGRRTTVTLAPQDDAATVSPLGGALFTLSVPASAAAPLEVRMTVRGTTAEGASTQHQLSTSLAPGTQHELPVYVYHDGAGPYWGMQGIPVYGPVSLTGVAPLDQGAPVQFTRLEVAVLSPPRRALLYLHRVRAFSRNAPGGRLVPHPFIDRFGQYVHADWAYKVTSEEDLKERDAREAATLAETGGVPGLDAYGGWADGPQLEATGFFRTEKVDGKWWLVTPDGHLFFSKGVTCVHRGDGTYITGRDDWFEAVPPKQAPFDAFFGHRSRAHSRADAIGGGGDTLNWYGVNLARKWGDAWRKKSRERAHARLHAWGFNTIANWSDPDIMRGGRLAYTVKANSGRVQDVAGTSGYWRKMKDVFDPDFVPNTRARLRALAEDYAGDPRVIGYFVDNEESWTGIPEGTLDSPADQPARQAFIADLMAKYGDLAALNAAWRTQAESWDTLRMPSRRTDAVREDAEAFLYRFAKTYFSTVADALAEYAPNQLYLGGRFALAYMPAAAVRACAEHADAISLNAYLEEISPDMLVEYDMPVIIGEFHFGALDRGMFHRGLVPAEDQADRARKYVNYVERVAANPVFVGCHWFQYMDQPATGRPKDGENYNIGLVNVCDIPYPELTSAARAVHERLYPMRYGMAE